jgi:D-proline reductase (dithiol) PrdB
MREPWQRRWKRIYDRLLAEAFDRSDLLKRLWSRSLAAREGVTPFVPPPPLARSTLALLTTGGFHHHSAPAFDMSDPKGDPSYREVEIARPASEYTITHDYYDHRDAAQDRNVVLPIERAQELVREGVLKGLYGRAYSFMGHLLDDTHIPKMEENAREIGRHLRREGVDIALLTPA